MASTTQKEAGSVSESSTSDSVPTAPQQEFMDVDDDASSPPQLIGKLEDLETTHTSKNGDGRKGDTETHSGENDDKPQPTLTSSSATTAFALVPCPHDAKTKESLEMSSKESINSSALTIKVETKTTIQSQTVSYEKGSQPGDVILRYNCDDSTYWNKQWKDTKTKDKVKWPIDKNPLQRPIVTTGTKYMFQQIAEAARLQNEAVDDLGLEITESYGLGQPADLRETSTEDVYSGRIKSDTGKLTPGAVLLEGTMETSGGHIIALDLSALEEYFIFTGQVLGLSGMNSNGRCIHVSKLYVPRPLPFHEGKIYINTATGPLSVVIAAGPFTPKNSLDFEPFCDLLNVIDQTRPDVCILIGPFLDWNHPIIYSQKKPLPESFDKMFKKRIKDLVTVVETFERPTQIVLVSSWKDAHHHPVYPTIPYMTDEFPNIVSVSDPSTISIGGILFGVTSNDILMHLGRNEVAHSETASDRMGRLAKHLLCQRNFYPLYPPDDSVPLDGELWATYAHMQVTPHVLILPSDLRHFIKNIEGCLVINPEKLSKHNSGGTYARILIDLPNNPDDTTGVGDGSPITEFVSGEIFKV